MTAYVTKYALTSGIKKVEGQITEDSPDILHVVKDGWSDYFVIEGKEWHRTIEAAQARADLMRLKKISGLSKQIKKLEAMTF